MAWGLGLSLGFLKLSLSERSVLSTSTGSVLPVNLCTGSSLQGDSPAVPTGTGRDPHPAGMDNGGVSSCAGVTPCPGTLPSFQAGISHQFMRPLGEGVMLEGKGERILGQGPSTAYVTRRKGLYRNSSCSVEGTVGRSSSSRCCRGSGGV